MENKLITEDVDYFIDRANIIKKWKRDYKDTEEHQSVIDCWKQRVLSLSRYCDFPLFINEIHVATDIPVSAIKYILSITKIKVYPYNDFFQIVKENNYDFDERYLMSYVWNNEALNKCEINEINIAAQKLKQIMNTTTPKCFNDFCPNYNHEKNIQKYRCNYKQLTRGLYFVYVYYINDDLFYIGESKNPYIRYLSHCSENNKYRDVTKIRIYELYRENEMHFLEEFLIRKNYNCQTMINREYMTAKEMTIHINEDEIPYNDFTIKEFTSCFQNMARNNRQQESIKNRILKETRWEDRSQCNAPL